MGSSEDFEQEIGGRVPWDARGVVRVVFFSARARGGGSSLLCCADSHTLHDEWTETGVRRAGGREEVLAERRQKALR